MTPGPEAPWLNRKLVPAGLVTGHPVRDRIRRLLGVDRGPAMIDRPGVASLFTASSTTQVIALLFSLGFDALSVLRDDSPLRPANVVRQAANQAAYESTGTPALVLLDDSDPGNTDACRSKAIAPTS